MMDDYLYLTEFFAIKSSLAMISDTWSDLWLALFLTQASPTQLLELKFEHAKNGVLILPATRRFKQKCIPLNPGLKKIIQLRRIRYPNDKFLFQSHANRTKAIPRPVTLVAFNTALKRASFGITRKTLSSTNAFHIKL
jgi:hypothetical protein